MRKTLLTAAALLSAISALPAHAAVSVTSTGFTYAQSFDSLASTGTAVAWANDSTILGWSLFTSAGTAITAYNANDGSSNTGSFYSFGTGTATDRALGATASGGAYFGTPATGALAGWIAASFTNNSGSALAGFTLGYTGEQWRNGGNTAAQSLTLQYGFGATFAGVTTWSTPGAAFNFTSPVVGATAAAVNGNTAGTVGGLGGSVAASWAIGDTLWVRWADLNDAANDHGLGIDNLSLSVTAVPEPGTLALLLAGVASVGFVARRRG